MGIAIILAFALTLITASSNVVLKKGFIKIHPFSAVYVSVIISTLLLWIVTIFFVPRTFFYNYKGILVFAIIGSFAPTIARTLTYHGIHKLGASRAAPLRAMTPFFATLIAIVFLKESPRKGIFFGVLLITLGIALLSNKKENEIFQWRFRHFLYPLGAALLAGIAANLRKFGLTIMPQPIFASTISATSSLAILTLFGFLKNNKFKIEKLTYSPELKLIIIAAFLTACGEIVDLSALLYGKVSLVVPIFATTPLVIVVLSKIFLKRHETVTVQLVFAAILIICGIYISITNAL